MDSWFLFQGLHKSLSRKIATASVENTRDGLSPDRPRFGTNLGELLQCPASNIASKRKSCTKPAFRFWNQSIVGFTTRSVFETCNLNLLLFFSSCARVGHELVPLKVLLNQSSQHPGPTKHCYWTRSVDQQQLEQTLGFGWHLWQYHEDADHVTTPLSHYGSHSICLVRRGFKRWSLQ